MSKLNLGRISTENIGETVICRDLGHVARFKKKDVKSVTTNDGDDA